jgi:hypothetical protein
MKAQRKQMPVVDDVRYDVHRLMVRIDPVHGESPLGYLCRTAGVFRYEANWFDKLLGYHIPHLDVVKGQDALKTSYTLRLQPSEWRELSYEESHIASRRRFCRFLGQPIRFNRLNLTRPRVCPECLREHEICLAVWDLAFVAACPIHHKDLIINCWKCTKPLCWSRPSTTQCRCGADLRERVGPQADSHVEAMTTALYLATNMSNERLRKPTSNLGFPAELDSLELNSLTTLVAFLGAMGQGKHAKQTAYVPTSLESTIELLRSAGRVLAKWPNGFHDFLSKMQKSSSQLADAITFRDAFGNHFRGLVGLGAEFTFLLVAFEKFIVSEWPGVVRRQHRSFSDSFHSQYPWITAQEAKRIAATSVPLLLSMVRDGTLEGKFVMPQGGHRRTECWIRRSSLDNFNSWRDKNHQRYMSQDEVALTLGLSRDSVVELCLCGAISSVDRSEKHLPRGTYYESHDVRRLSSLCRSLWGRKLNVGDSRGIISLADARRKILGGRGTLANVFIDIMKGALVPVGHISSADIVRFSGLVFRRSDLTKYAKPIQRKSLPTGFITHHEAARKLKTNTEVVRNLAAAKLLLSRPEPFNRFRIVSLEDVESFGQTYIAMRTLADQFKTRSVWVAQYLETKGVTVLTIDLPGKGKKLFVKRSDVNEVVIPRAKRARHQKEIAPA